MKTMNYPARSTNFKSPSTQFSSIQHLILFFWGIFICMGIQAADLDTVSSIFSMTSMELQEDSSYLVTIAAGSEQGVYEQENASVLTVYDINAKGTDRENQIIGSVKFDKVGFVRL